MSGSEFQDRLEELLLRFEELKVCLSWKTWRN